MTPSEFFEHSLPEPNSGCWLWEGGGTGRQGQAMINGRRLVASRAAWEIARGQIPDGLFVLHKCDVGRCVNPDHLFIGTQSVNMKDCADKGRLAMANLMWNQRKTHCPAGHSYSGKNLSIRKSTGHRRCLACNRARGLRNRILALTPRPTGRGATEAKDGD